MSRGSQAAVVALVLVAAAAIALWWSATFKRVDEWVDLPSRGEAAYNPLYGLRLALQADGVRARTRQRLDLDTVTLHAQDTVLVYSDPRTLTAAELDRLLDWVAEGGHLLLRVPAFQYGRSTHPLGAPLADAFPVKGELLAPRCAPLRLGDEKPHPEFCGGARFALDGEVEPVIALGDPQRGHAFARFAHGEGHVDLLGELAFLGDKGLREPHHVALTRHLLAPNYGRGTMHLVYAATLPPLWRWLLERAWMALLPLAIALAGWLWMRAGRFGPWLPPLPGTRRSLLEHVQASGEHLHRYGRASLLQAAARQALVSRLGRRDPVAAVLSGPAQAEAVARRTGLPVADVAAALDTRAAPDTHELRTRISRLIALRNRL